MILMKKKKMSMNLCLLLWLLIIMIKTTSSHKHNEDDDLGNEVICRRCGAVVANTKGLLIDKKGKKEDDDTELIQLQTFTNPNNLKFNLVNFKDDEYMELQAQALKYKESSFYPPHKWQAAVCPICGSHLGWKFELSNSKTDAMLEKVDNMELSNEDTEMAISKIAKIIQKFDHKCIPKTIEYWTYLFCQIKEIRQFHVHKLATTEEIKEGNIKKDPDWSLGTYVKSSYEHTKKLKRFSDFKSKIPYRIDFYDGGQRCDETDGARHTYVRYLCCKKGPEKGGRLQEIKEIEICTYEMDICVAKLCKLQSTLRKKKLKQLTEAKAIEESENKEEPNMETEQATKYPDTFWSIIWSNVLLETSQELEWVQKVKPRPM